MLSIEGLKALGVDTDDGLGRCLNNEEFYFKLVNMALNDASYDQLKAAVEAGDLDEAFERAHALKGILGNVSLKNLLTPVETITEELRAKNDIDYTPYITQMFEELEKLRALAAE